MALTGLFEMLNRNVINNPALETMQKLQNQTFSGAGQMLQGLHNKMTQPAAGAGAGAGGMLGGGGGTTAESYVPQFDFRDEGQKKQDYQRAMASVDMSTKQGVQKAMQIARLYGDVETVQKLQQRLQGYASTEAMAGKGNETARLEALLPLAQAQGDAEKVAQITSRINEIKMRQLDAAGAEASAKAGQARAAGDKATAEARKVAAANMASKSGDPDTAKMIMAGLIDPSEYASSRLKNTAKPASNKDRFKEVDGAWWDMSGDVPIQVTAAKPEPVRAAGDYSGMSEQDKKRLYDMQDTSAATNATADRAGQNLQRIDMLGDFSGGTLTSIAEGFKSVTGTKDDLSFVRDANQRDIVKDWLNNLPPGVASDRDVAIVSEAYPGSDASAAELRDYWKKVQRAAQVAKDYESFMLDYAHEKGSLLGAERMWNEKRNGELSDRAMSDRANMEAARADATETVFLKGARKQPSEPITRYAIRMAIAAGDEGAKLFEERYGVKLAPYKAKLNRQEG